MTRSKMCDWSCHQLIIIILNVFCILISLSNADEYGDILLHEREDDVEPSKRPISHSLDVIVPSTASAQSAGEQWPLISTPHTVSASLFLNMYQLRPRPDSHNASSRLATFTSFQVPASLSLFFLPLYQFPSSSSLGAQKPLTGSLDSTSSKSPSFPPSSGGTLAQRSLQTGLNSTQKASHYAKTECTTTTATTGSTTLKYITGVMK